MLSQHNQEIHQTLFHIVGVAGDKTSIIVNDLIYILFPTLFQHNVLRPI